MTPKVSYSTPSSLLQRSLAAYYRAGGLDHPDPHMFGHFMAEYDVGEGITGFREYIRLAHAGGTLAVFRIYWRGDYAELKRLKRWPKDVEDGSAMTLAQFNVWCDEQVKLCGTSLSDRKKDDLDELLNRLELAT